MLNKTFRLFISSTFDDFKEEREILNGEVFSLIDHHCQTKGYNFQLIDLRWGVNSEAALTQNTLSICLEEVRRCKELSPKPNFLIMVGERYGWIPLPFKIEVDDFETIISASTPDEASLLQEWYLLDTNEIGGIYYLKPRTGASTDDCVWNKIEEKLHYILCTYATKCDLSTDLMTTLYTSATEAEIIEGLLSDEEKKKSTLALFRSGHTKKDTDTTKVDLLKNKIRNYLSGDENKNSIISLDYSSGYCCQFREKITSLLLEHIDAEISRLESQDEPFNDDYILDQILDECGLSYLPMEEQLKRIDKYLQSDCRTPLFITGASGSGKTTLLADLLKHTSFDAFFSFYGLSENSYSLTDSLNHIFKRIETKYSLAKSFEVRQINIAEAVHNAIRAIPVSEKVLIVIDGLDMFSDIQEIHENIFPAQLPANVKLILAAANETIITRFKQEHASELVLTDINSQLCYDTFSKILRQHNRCISNYDQKKQIKGAVSNGASPMHIKLIASQCLSWRSSETNTILSINAQSSALQYIFSMFEKHGHNKELVLYTLGLICAAPFGIAEEEIQQLVLRFPSVKEYFDAEDRHHYNQEKLPFVIWSRLFYDLKDCLILTKVNGCIVVKFRHQIFDTVLQSACPQHLQEARSLLVKFYIEQNSYCDSTKIPNWKKAYNLLALLRKNEDVANICQSLMDISFVDSVVKIGHIEELINACNYVLRSDINEDIRLSIVKLYYCLLNNRNRLLCYKDSFCSCAYEYSLEGIEKPIFVTNQIKNKDKFTLFPYSHKSTVSWFLEANCYAVCHSAYVYIVNNDTGTEICRIFLGPNVSGEPQIAKSATWLDQNSIIVTCQDGPLLVYDISNNALSLIHSFDLNTDNCSIRYCQEYEMLLYTNGRILHAINPFSGNEYYSIPIKTPISGFDIDAFAGELYLCTDPLHIQVFNLHCGSAKKLIRTKKKRRIIDDWGRKIQGGYGVLKLRDDLWFIYAPALLDAPPLYSVFDAVRNRMTYFTLPANHTGIFLNSLLLGRRSCIIFSEESLIYIDFYNNFKLGCHYAKSIFDVAWVNTDDRISVLSHNGLEILDVSTLPPLEGTSCILSNREQTDNFSLAIRNGKRLASVTSMAISSNYFSYSKLFHLMQYATSNIWNRIPNIASIIIEANDGKTAIAYETSDSIVVYSAKGERQLHIDKLRLAINDNILNLAFSPDSKCLLIWRNHSLVIIDVETSSTMLKLDLRYRPAFKVCFGKDSKSVYLTLCDNHEYLFLKAKNRFIAEASIPEKLVSEVDLDAYFGPYNIYPPTHQPRSYTRINADAFDATILPRKWFVDTHVYLGKTFWILFKDGHFFLNGDTNAVFSAPYCDFKHGLQLERQYDSSEFAMYLREKNDFLSYILELDNNHFILVSRILNAVVLFDQSKLEIVATHKFQGNILGIRNFSRDAIEIFTDVMVDPISLSFNWE